MAPARRPPLPALCSSSWCRGGSECDGGGGAETTHDRARPTASPEVGPWPPDPARSHALLTHDAQHCNTEASTMRQELARHTRRRAAEAPGESSVLPEPQCGGGPG